MRRWSLGSGSARLRREVTQGALADFELRPEALAVEGIVPALGKQAADLSARSGLPIVVDGSRDRLDLEPKVEEHLYRIVLEALNNTIKHAHATHATVDVSATGGRLAITISDDGTGFDVTQPYSGHLGLATMRERAEALGAGLSVSAASETGTTVRVIVEGQPSAAPDRDG